MFPEDIRMTPPKGVIFVVMSRNHIGVLSFAVCLRRDFLCSTSYHQYDLLRASVAPNQPTKSKNAMLL